jgi:serine/threonine-protein kinase
MGRVKTTGAAPGRRIFVDERTVGQTPDAVLVKCGTRAIKVGSSGSTRQVDVPCGGEITVGDR